MSVIDDKNLIEKFLSNNCDYYEAEYVAAYLESNVEALDKILLTEELDSSEIVRLRYYEKEEIVESIIKEKKGKLVAFKRWMVAASIIGLFALSWWLFDSDSEKLVVTPEIAVVENRLKNSSSQNMSYVLPDSSEILLLPEAEIVYKTDFTHHRSLVLVEGDVYFVVKHAASRPFEVITNGVKTTVLGTKFWIKNFKMNNIVRISLVQGKVMINSVDEKFTMDTVFLKPNQICSINKTLGTVDIITKNENAKNNTPPSPSSAKKEVKASSEIVWTNNDIQFSNVSLSNVFAKLEDRYNVKIIAANPEIMNTYLTGKIFYSDSLNTIIKSICEINNMTYEKRSDTIFLKKK